MASNFKLETRDERIERMNRDNPGRALELCTVVVDQMWDKRKELINSQIPERFKNASIEDLGYVSLAVNRAVAEMLQPPEENDKVGTIFCGPAGSGKTHAAYAVIHKLAEKNPEMIGSMITYSEAFASIRNEFLDGSYEEMGSVWDRLNNNSGTYDGVLLLDDVSAKKLTDFELDKFLMFLEKRFNYYLPFILTTNIKREDFKEVFGERIASRLIGYCNVVTFDGDKRIEKI